MEDLTLEEAFDELSSAEDFLEYFNVAYDAPVVHVNRLHILQRFHDYIKRAGADSFAQDEEQSKAQYKELLQKALLKRYLKSSKCRKPRKPLYLSTS